MDNGIYNKSVEKRFLDKVVKTNSCWFWIGSNNGVGYGEIRIKNKKFYAHRWSYTYYTGKEIPNGYQIDHLCRNSSCVNPDHLEAVTPRTNVLRGDASKERPERKKKYCINGHLYSKNEYIRLDGKGRNCEQCVRDRAREYMRRKNGYYDRHPEELNDD